MNAVLRGASQTAVGSARECHRTVIRLAVRCTKKNYRLHSREPAAWAEGGIVADSYATLVQGRWRVDRMKQIIRELKRHVAGEKLEPEQLRALIRAGYVYRDGDEHLITDKGYEALAQPGVYPRVEH
jgi:hypothetical protein